MQNFANKKPILQNKYRIKMPKHTKQRHNHKTNNPTFSDKKGKPKMEKGLGVSETVF
jgi:hypothetical protein